MLGGYSNKLLKAPDTSVRGILRQILPLPKNAPISSLNAAVTDGGLGVPSLQIKIPIMRKDRILKLTNDNSQLFNSLINSNYVTTHLNRYRVPKIMGTKVNSPKAALPLWARSGHSFCDSSGLAYARQDAHYACHRWLEYFSLSGFVFINLYKLRTNTIETPSRSVRGRGLSPRCSFRCGVVDSLGHWLQGCPTTHDFRITRHDHVVQFLKK